MAMRPCCPPPLFAAHLRLEVRTRASSDHLAGASEAETPPMSPFGAFGVGTPTAPSTTAAAGPAAPPLCSPENLLADKVSKLYVVLISMHGLVRGEAMELGRDPDTGECIALHCASVVHYSLQSAVPALHSCTSCLLKGKLLKQCMQNRKGGQKSANGTCCDRLPSVACYPSAICLGNHLQALICRSVRHSSRFGRPGLFQIVQGPHERWLAQVPPLLHLTLLAAASCCLVPGSMMPLG